jgi:hypothetical protein
LRLSRVANRGLAQKHGLWANHGAVEKADQDYLRPRIISAAFSAIMMTGALIVSADQVRHHRGVGDAQPIDPENAQLAVDHRRIIALGTHLAGSERVMDATAGRPDMRVDLLVRDFCRSPARSRSR